MTLTEMRETLELVKFPGHVVQLGLKRLHQPMGLYVFYVQVSCAHNPDGFQQGRKWMVSEHMTRSELVQTAFKAVLSFVEHETREQFTYRGRAIFGPHFHVDNLVALCDEGKEDVR